MQQSNSFPSEEAEDDDAVETIRSVRELYESEHDEIVAILSTVGDDELEVIASDHFCTDGDKPRYSHANIISAPLLLLSYLLPITLPRLAADFMIAYHGRLKQPTAGLRCSCTYIEKTITGRVYKTMPVTCNGPNRRADGTLINPAVPPTNIIFTQDDGTVYSERPNLSSMLDYTIIPNDDSQPHASAANTDDQPEEEESQEESEEEAHELQEESEEEAHESQEESEEETTSCIEESNYDEETLDPNATPELTVESDAESGVGPAQ